MYHNPVLHALPASTFYPNVEVEEEVSYLSKSYAPLSNLPTPPSSYSSIQSRQSILDFSAIKSPELLGPAIYLTNLIPSAASVLDPDPKLVHALLIRASLPLEIIALACCILDSLNCRFARKWRRRCPIQAGLADDTVSHIDIIRPEIIVLSSLILAVKFQDDSEASSKAYCTHWGLGAWTVSQLNVTEQCILETLGYRIMPLWKEDLIQDALLDMERAGMNAWYGDSWSMASDYTFQETQDSPSKAMSAGKAVWTAQRQLTPVLTPRAEMAPFIADYLRIESTFRLASPQLSYQGAILDLPIRVLGLLDLQSEPAISVASN